MSLMKAVKTKSSPYRSNNEIESPARKRIVEYLKRRDSSLLDGEVATILDDIKRFVNLTRRIYTEPQAKVTYEDVLLDGKVKTIRTFNTDLNELKKIKKSSKQEPIKNVMERFRESVMKGDYD